MSERLKGSTHISYTVNLGNYQSFKVEAMTEYYLDESSAISEIDSLDKNVKEWMTARGIAPKIVMSKA